MHIEGLEGYASIFSPFFGTNQRTDAEGGKNRDDWPKKSHFGSDIQNETTGGTNMARPSSAGELAVRLEMLLTLHQKLAIKKLTKWILLIHQKHYVRLN